MLFPVSHCTLYPIELAWAQVKGHIKTNTKMFNLMEVEKLAWEGFSILTVDHWKKLIKHVQDKVEDHCWSCDSLCDQYVRQFVIQVGEGDSESDADSADDVDSEHSNTNDGGTSDGDVSSDDDSYTCSCDN